MKNIVLLLSGLAAAISSVAQETVVAEKSFMDDPLSHPMLPYYVVFSLLFVAIVLVAVVGVYVLRIVNVLSEQAAKEKAQRLGVAYAPSPGWWARFAQKMNASVPVEQEKNIEMDHSYDGIRELDNHLPP
jgi:cytochrome c oxidase cbb3-type subunit 3